jgi:hypothetical protein
MDHSDKVARRPVVRASHLKRRDVMTRDQTVKSDTRFSPLAANGKRVHNGGPFPVTNVGRANRSV